MSDRRYKVGVIVSALWVTVAVALLLRDLGATGKMTPNEWGDFLAGIFAPLAFLWLVLGYMQQGEELRLSTAALRLQADELRNSVGQQRELVDVSRLQIQSEREALEASLAVSRLQAKAAVASQAPVIRWHNDRVRLFMTDHQSLPRPDPVKNGQWAVLASGTTGWSVDDVIFENVGKTSAAITEYCVHLLAADELPAEPDYGATFHTNEFIVPGESRGFPFNGPRGRRKPYRPADRNQRKLWIYGFLQYVDFMGERQRFGFCGRWEETDAAGLYGRGFLPDGPRSYTYIKSLPATPVAVMSGDLPQGDS